MPISQYFFWFAFMVVVLQCVEAGVGDVASNDVRLTAAEWNARVVLTRTAVGDDYRFTTREWEDMQQLRDDLDYYLTSGASQSGAKKPTWLPEMITKLLLELFPHPAHEFESHPPQEPDSTPSRCQIKEGNYRISMASSVDNVLIMVNNVGITMASAAAHFTQRYTDNGAITLQAITGHYLSVEQDGKVMMRNVNAGAMETFIIVESGDGASLQTADSRFYIYPTRNDEVRTAEILPGIPREGHLFNIIKNGDVISFQSQTTDMYMSLQLYSLHVANMPAGGGELFHITYAPDGQGCNIRSITSNTYMIARNKRFEFFIENDPDEDGIFFIEKEDPGMYSFDVGHFDMFLNMPPPPYNGIGDAVDLTGDGFEGRFSSIKNFISIHAEKEEMRGPVSPPKRTLMTNTIRFTMEDRCVEEEEFSMVSDENYFTIRAYTGKYVTVEPNGHIIVDKDEPGKEGQFQLEPHPDEKIDGDAIRHVQSGRYLRLEFHSRTRHRGLDQYHVKADGEAPCKDGMFAIDKSTVNVGKMTIRWLGQADGPDFYLYLERMWLEMQRTRNSEPALPLLLEHDEEEESPPTIIADPPHLDPVLTSPVSSSSPIDPSITKPPDINPVSAHDDQPSIERGASTQSPVPTSIEQPGIKDDIWDYIIVIFITMVSTIVAIIGATSLSQWMTHRPIFAEAQFEPVLTATIERILAKYLPPPETEGELSNPPLEINDITFEYFRRHDLS